MSDIPALVYFFVAAFSHNPAALTHSQELQATQLEELRAVFASLDADGDGYISRREAEKDAEVRRTFRRADADKDGRLDPHEFAVAQFLSRIERPSQYANTRTSHVAEN
jgi:hypothetical protein